MDSEVTVWRVHNMSHVVLWSRRMRSWTLLCTNSSFTRPRAGMQKLRGGWREHAVNCVNCVARLAYLAAL